jgi:CheY-like chemotaxis protein
VTGEKKAEQPAAQAREPQPIVPGGVPKGERPAVLVVDDKGYHREILVAALEGAGYRMLEAGDARSALALLRQEGPGLVFLDLDLRGSDVSGLQLLAMLKRERPDVPVIAYTAYAPLEWQERARAAGCDGYLVKPIVPLGQVRAIAQKYLGRPAEGPRPLGGQPDPLP